MSEKSVVEEFNLMAWRMSHDLITIMEGIEYQTQVISNSLFDPIEIDKAIQANQEIKRILEKIA